MMGDNILALSPFNNLQVKNKIAELEKEIENTKQRARDLLAIQHEIHQHLCDKYDKTTLTLHLIATEGYGRPTEMMVAARKTLKEVEYE